MQAERKTGESVKKRTEGPEAKTASDRRGSMEETETGRFESPEAVRQKIRNREITGPTAGLCPGYAQANLVVLPKKYAYDFLLFAMRNPRSCPILEVTDAGDRTLKHMGKNADLATDLPKYRTYEYGKLTGEYVEVGSFWKEDFVSFLIGCSFSFEDELMRSGIEIRHITEHKNVPMYVTDIPDDPAGPFSGTMVVSMRPIPYALIPRAAAVTAGMPRVHGAPIQIGHPEAIGIQDLSHPDYGDAVTVGAGEEPVFWPCGVTPQEALLNSRIPFAITHAPGHMFITDVKNSELKF